MIITWALADLMEYMWELDTCIAYNDLIWVVNISAFLHVKNIFEKHTIVHATPGKMWKAVETSAASA